jgi:hypothetical protein
MKPSVKLGRPSVRRRDSDVFKLATHSIWTLSMRSITFSFKKTTPTSNLASRTQASSLLERTKAIEIWTTDGRPSALKSRMLKNYSFILQRSMSNLSFSRTLSSKFCLLWLKISAWTYTSERRIGIRNGNGCDVTYHHHPSPLSCNLLILLSTSYFRRKQKRVVVDDFFVVLGK